MSVAVSTTKPSRSQAFISKPLELGVRLVPRSAAAGRDRRPSICQEDRKEVHAKVATVIGKLMEMDLAKTADLL